VDYRLYHSINLFVAGHDWLGSAVGFLETWAVPLFGLATIGLWFLARPGGRRKWKLASASAITSAAVALLVAQAISKTWPRERPFVAHPDAHVWGSRSHDPSFPSDHASAAFGIAFAIFLFDRVVGAIFLGAATLIAVGRVFVGAHYPADVLAGTLVGIGAAVLVVRAGMPLVERAVRMVERLTDPVVSLFRRHALHPRRGL